MARAPVFPTKLLDKTAVVYSEGVGGDYSVVANAALPCLLGIVNGDGGRSGGRTSEERADLAQLRTLVWTQGYAMPETAQVEVDGERWNVLPGSYNAATWPFDGTVLYRTCDLMRVK
ncbi:MAG: hypothetical protein ACYC4L_04650 [Chloroflexota bacterium]